MIRRVVSTLLLTLCILATTMFPGSLNVLSEAEAIESQPVSPDALFPAAIGPAGGLADTAFSTSVTANAENVEFVGHIGGQTYAVAVQGKYAYIGEGYSVTVLDISDPASPTVVGRTPLLPGVVQGIAVTGGHAYVANDSGGLRVIDVSTPSNPTEVSACQMGVAQDVAAVGNYAYVIAGGDLQVVDVSDLANPTRVGFYDTPGQAHSVAVAGSYAYIAARSGGLRVVDISDPTTPTEVGFYDTPKSAIDVAVAGSYAYVTDYDYDGSCLHVVDISVPSNPTRTGFRCDSWQQAYNVAVAGNYAYVLAFGLRVVDVSRPTNPREVGFYARGTGDVAVAGDYAYVGDYYGGLGVVDVSVPSNPTKLGLYDTLWEGEEIAVSGDYAYVADGGNLRVVDVSAPSNPMAVGFYQMPAQKIAVAEDYAYVMAGVYGLRVVDVSDPIAPKEVGFYETPRGANGLAVAGQYAYVAHQGGLSVVDISDPTSPMEVGSCDAGWGNGVAVAGGYAYIADANGLYVVDISNPADPARVGYSGSPEDAADVAVAGGYAYVADQDQWNGGLRVMDVSNPTRPTLVGFYNMPGREYDVAVAGNYAYVAAGSGGLRVVDVSDPTNPREVGFYQVLEGVKGVAIAGGYIYVTHVRMSSVTGGGLFILRFVPPPEVTVLTPLPGSIVYHGDSLLVKANVALGGQPFVVGRVDGSIPLSGSSITFGLYDDGGHEDGAANDGLYAARITLYDPLTMPAGNYTIIVTAIGENGSGSDSTNINVTSAGGGAPAVSLGVSGPSAPDFFAGEQVTLVVTLTYPDSSIHTGTAVTVTLTAPNLGVTYLRMNNVSATTWQGSYVLPIGQGGTYYFDARADPPPSTYFVDGFGGAQVYVYAGELDITVNPPPGTAFLYSTVPLSACVTAGGMPVSGATVDAEINLPVIEDGGTLLEVGSSGCYGGYYVPTHTGLHNVTYTAEKPGYVGTTASGSFQVSTERSSLAEQVQRFGVDADRYAGRTRDVLLQVAQDGDYFGQQLREDQAMFFVQALADIFFVGVDAVDVMRTPSTEAARLLSIHKLPGGRPAIESALSAREAIDMMLSDTAQEMITTVGAEDLAFSLLMEAPARYYVTAGNPNQYLRGSIRSYLLEEYPPIIRTESGGDRQSLEEHFLQILSPAIVANRNDILLNTADVVNNLPSITAEDEAIYIRDLVLRQKANGWLSYHELDHRGSFLFLTQDKREAEEHDWFKKLIGPFIWGGLKLGSGALCDGPCSVIVSVAEGFYNAYQNNQAIAEDQRMRDLAVNLMHLGYETQAILWSNTNAGLAQVQAYEPGGSLPEVPQGELSAIRFMRTTSGPPFYFGRDVYAEVTVYNPPTGITTLYSVKAYYATENGYRQVSQNTVDPSNGRERLLVELAPGQSKTVRLYLKKYNEFDDCQPRQGDWVRFNLFAYTDSDQGVYLVDSKPSQEYLPAPISAAAPPISIRYLSGLAGLTVETVNGPLKLAVTDGISGTADFPLLTSLPDTFLNG